jgi:hypothetical protein
MASRKVADYLKDKKDYLAIVLREIYAEPRYEHLSRILGNTRIDTTLIIGNSVAAKIDSFIDCCIHNEDDRDILEVFNKLDEENPGNELISEIYQFLKLS